MSGAALTLAAFLAMAPRCAGSVSPDTLAPVIQTESRFYLYSVNVNRNGRSIGSRRFGSEAEAVAAVRELLAAGVDNLDVGPAQLNWRAGHLQRRGLSIEAALRPCPALSVAADVLVDCWRRAPVGAEQARLDAAISCYNTGSFTRGLARPAGGNGYVGLVRANAEHIVPALRLAGRDVPPLPEPGPDPVRPPQEAAPPPCAPSWDPWAQLACGRRTPRPTPPPVRRKEAPPTPASARGGAGAVASNTSAQGVR